MSLSLSLTPIVSCFMCVYPTQLFGLGIVIGAFLSLIGPRMGCNQSQAKLVWAVQALTVAIAVWAVAPAGKGEREQTYTQYSLSTRLVALEY